MTEYLRLIADSPGMELTLLDAEDIRSGELDGVELLVMPGGDSRMEKRDLGSKGAELTAVCAKKIASDWRNK